MDLSTSFGTETASYEAGRPEYPREAVRWMLAETLPNAQVADVGAGTGKLSRMIRDATGHLPHAIDPDTEMLAALQRATPDAQTGEGTAESLPYVTAAYRTAVTHLPRTRRGSR